MEALGPILIVLSIPLVFRWIPRNRFYGFRIPPTCRSDAVWYEVNALWARHMILLGLLMVALEFVLPVSARIPVLRLVGWVGLGGVVVVDWRAANRIERRLHEAGVPTGRS